jgi:hypothetical protein
MLVGFELLRVIRILFATFIALLHPMHYWTKAAGDGTLVLLVPTKAGLVVAADTRHTMLGVSCDNESKIYVPNNPPATVAVVTGLANFLAVKQPFGPDPCKDIADGIPLLSVPPIVLQYLEANSATAREANLDELAQICLNRVVKVLANMPRLDLEFNERPIFTVGVATFYNDTGTTLIRSFEIWFKNSEVVARQGLGDEYRSTDRPDLFAFGQGGYLKKQVLRGPGRQFVGPEYETFSGLPSIGDVDVKLASDVAVNLIEATSKTGDIVPLPTGVGGPVDVVLISNSNPQKLR